jgi:hypothetical protein
MDLMLTSKLSVCDMMRVEYTMYVEPLTPYCICEDRKRIGGRTCDVTWNHQK